MAIFWDIAPCSLVETDWHFRGAYCLHHQAWSAVSTEISVNLYQTKWHNIPEDSHLHTCHHENLKYHQTFFFLYTGKTKDINQIYDMSYVRATWQQTQATHNLFNITSWLTTNTYIWMISTKFMAFCISSWHYFYWLYDNNTNFEMCQYHWTHIVKKAILNKMYF
jgi:hypothetical protein